MASLGCEGVPKGAPLGPLLLPAGVIKPTQESGKSVLVCRAPAAVLEGFQNAWLGHWELFWGSLGGRWRDPEGTPGAVWAHVAGPRVFQVGLWQVHRRLRSLALLCALTWGVFLWAFVALLPALASPGHSFASSGGVGFRGLC